ncbi:MAG TPA: type II toxin-antitoxin system VapC family toxin [Thermoanaerobaculaceae bacterium]|nr:type II toxin-antitoxin system VapC family toxin [Thermoanaerobaculaceae bacterium]HRS17501.1 type II toxin-antitoxin system VapC family toxin [Thermoanaerobaculaceae bacterium]
MDLSRKGGLTIVADTDVLIDFLRGHEPMAGRIALELERGWIATTAVTRFELKAGARGGAQQALVDTLLAALPVMPLDGEAADRAAEVRRHLEQQGAPIGMADSLIAGIVIRHGRVLLTRNRRHFERVPGLALSVQT